MKLKKNNFRRALGKNIDIKENDGGYSLFYKGYWYNKDIGWDKNCATVFINKNEAENYTVDYLVQIYKDLSYVLS